MRAASERGAGKLGAILWLIFFAAVIWATFHVAPVYFADGQLHDKMNEMARAPRWSHPDERIMDTLMKYVREERLDQWIKRTNFSISTVETSRRITVSYEREVEVLPGVKHTFKFNRQVDQPLI